MEKTQAQIEFENFSAVPRRSFHNEKAIEYCINWAKDHGLEYFFDEKNKNLLIMKPATPGMEDKPGIALQGHLDMVAVCDEGIVHDWENEGIDLLIDGDFYTANGTTLGGDDGMAVAIAFALLSDETARHPALEVLLTTDEEVGMCSVREADLTFMKSKYMINIDSGGEGEFTVGCAGGSHIDVIVPNIREKISGNTISISVTGLQGGHSGVEITNERANALKILGDVLYSLSREVGFRICGLEAEGKDNAIQKEAGVVIVTDETPVRISELIERCKKKIRRKFRLADPDIDIRISSTRCEDALCEKESESLMALLHLLPFGVHHFDQNLKFIETSMNVGPVTKDERGIAITCMIRSSVGERSEEVQDMLRHICSLTGAEYVDKNETYPAWLPDFDTYLLKQMSAVYEEMYGVKPRAVSTHGGLECGYILANSNIEEVVALGPDCYDEHSTNERLSIPSLNRTYDFVKAVVERL